MSYQSILTLKYMYNFNFKDLKSKNHLKGNVLIIMDFMTHVTMTSNKSSIYHKLNLKVLNYFTFLLQNVEFFFLHGKDISLFRVRLNANTCFTKNN